MNSLQNFTDGFRNEPGYLDFGRVGPLSEVVMAEILGQNEVLSRARFGSLDHLAEQDLRARTAVSTLTGFTPDQVVLQPNTSSGLMQAMFGLTGSVLLSAADFPSVPSGLLRPCTWSPQCGWRPCGVASLPARSATSSPPPSRLSRCVSSIPARAIAPTSTVSDR
jgi:hypothetical protein